MSINAEDLILAHNLKTERSAIPVNVSVAVDQGRIDPNAFMDDTMKELEESLKADHQGANEKFTMAREEEKKVKRKLQRREALRMGTIKSNKPTDAGSVFTWTNAENSLKESLTLLYQLLC